MTTYDDVTHVHKQEKEQQSQQNATRNNNKAHEYVKFRKSWNWKKTENSITTYIFDELFIQRFE